MAELCCGDMSYVLKASKDIDYHSISRSFSARIDTPEGTHIELGYCPWCGTKLPESLSSKWMDVLRDEYGITDPNFDEADKVPAEFRSDEWWKRRGL